MKMLDNLLRKIPEYAKRRCEKIARSISDKASANIDKASIYLSDYIDIPMVYEVNQSSGNEIIYEVNVIGKQVAFLEFGTGVYNEPFMNGVNGTYIPSIVNKGIPSRASYGDGKGSRYHWAFYPTYSGNVSSANGDKIYDYRVYYRKRDGGVSIYQLKKPVIVTKGIAPQRMIYNAIRDTLREVKKK